MGVDTSSKTEAREREMRTAVVNKKNEASLFILEFIMTKAF